MKFTTTHEWILVDGDIATLGITDKAKQELGEIVYIELPMLGKQVQQGDEIAVLESTKAAADIYAPISGEVVEINSALTSAPTTINQGALQEGWLCKIKVKNPSEIHSLLSEEAYCKL